MRLAWSVSRYLPLFAALFAASAVGCGLARCDVSGKVTYRGKPVVCGCVVLVGVDGLPITANLEQDGSYAAKEVPVGKVQAAVYSLDPARARDPERERGAGGGVFDAADPTAPKDLPPRAVPGDKSNWMNPEVDRSKWFPLPRRFETIQTSGLSALLERGQNTVHFELK
jgi:hypothetical protein